MLDLRIIKLHYYPPDVFDIGYEGFFERIEHLEILAPLMQTPSKFIFVVEIEWKKKPNISVIKDIPFIEDVSEISQGRKTSMALISGSFPSEFEDIIDRFSNQFECFLEFPLTFTPVYISGSMVGTKDNLNKFLGFIDNWGAEYKIQSIKKYIFPGSGVLSTLTPQQYRCLKHALENGYFEIPKRFDSRALASQLDISHTTFLEHIRKSERVIFELLFRK